MHTADELTKLIGKIGYEILDDIVAPTVGISGIVADLYLADVPTYTSDESEDEIIINRFIEKYNIDSELGWEYFINMPIALLALYVLENTDYIAKHE